jgi:hypothetical protein
MANVNIQLGYKDSAWFAANATLVLLAGQVVYLQQTGTYKIGNGVTQLSALAFLGSSVIATETQLVTATVVNKTGVNLLASNYQAVKVSTAQGQRLAVDFAQANNDNNSADTIGLVRENISNNQEGDVVILGQIIEVNTTGSLQGETWADGDVLYLSPTVAGRITNIKPTGATGHTVVIGYIEYAHAIHGKIYTKIMNGWEVEELHNVSDTSYTTPIDADSLLIKDSTAALWKRLTWANLKTLIFTIPSLVSQAAGVAITGVQWVLGSKQWIGGNITTQKEIELTSPSYSFTTSSTITNAYSMYVNAPTASTNATITNNYAIGANGNILMTNNKAIQVLDGTGTPRNLINYTSADNININGKQGSSDIFINPTSTNKGMVLKSTGTIGIYGVATPTARLHVGAGESGVNSAPLKFTSGTNQTTAEAGSMEYNNTLHFTNSDATRRHVALSPNSTKVTAGAPYTNDGYITLNINGIDFKILTTA